MALYYCVFHALCGAFRPWAFFRSGIYRVPHDHGIIRTTVCQTCISAIHQVSYLCRNSDIRFSYRAEGNGDSWSVFYVVILILSSSLTMGAKIPMRFFLGMLNYKGNAREGFTPTDVAPSRYNKPGTGNRSLSFNEGGEWGTNSVLSFIVSVLCSSYHSTRNSPGPLLHAEKPVQKRSGSRYSPMTD